MTEFFRDPHVADDMRLAIVPELARVQHPLRVWSAGCSSGQELYSLAILLAEAGLLERASLVGTDCRPEAIATARAGIYTSTDLDPLPSAVRSKYFDAIGGAWRVTRDLQQHAEWRVADLWSEAEHGPFDLICWRNVAIYLNPGPAARILSRLVDALRPGGFLVLGKAERASADLELVPISRCVYRKTGGVLGVA